MPKSAHIIELTDFFDKSGLTTDIYKAAYDFGEEHLLPYDKSLIGKAACDISHPKHIWKLMAKDSYLGAGAPTKFGGMGANFLQQNVITHAFSYHCPSVGLSYLANDDLGLGRILEWATDDQIMKYSQACIVEGAAAALAMSEPNAGSDVMSMRSTAAPDGKTETDIHSLDAEELPESEYYTLNGTKTWITNGASAEVLVVYFKSAKDKLTAFLIDKDTSGFSVNRKITKNGMKGSETAELSFNNCRVHKSQILGGLHNGKKVLGKGLNTERVKLATAGEAIGQRGFDETCAYISTREQFDAPLAANQSVAFDIADMGSQLMTMDKSILLTAYMHDNGKEVTRQSAANVFLEVGDRLPKIMTKCVELFGGNGLTDEYAIGQLKNDSDLYITGGGTIKMRQEILARHFLPVYDAEQEFMRGCRQERKEKSRIILN